MKMKQLDDKLAATMQAIKENSKDPQLATHLLAELLSVKGQIDVKPVLFEVPMDEVVKEHDFQSYKFVECKKGVMFLCGGIKFYAPAVYTAQDGDNGGALYDTLKTFCEMDDRKDSMSEDERLMFDTFQNILLTYMVLPLDAFADSDFTFDVAKYIVEKKQKMYQELLDKPLKEETAEDDAKNQEFEMMYKQAEEIVNTDSK